ncbi:HGxxPAAW family protein [Streptomyces sp. NPDC060194]|uniref:HGxxPAAW family protein n=1 Tax=Streptomyces sp. NPDC060194 TaxID=3347069 RepID=UPI0036470C56
MSGNSHGHTPAAWTGVTIAFIGFCISGVFMVLNQPVLFWLGLVVVLLGGLVGWGMAAAGMGMPKEPHDPVTKKNQGEPEAKVIAQAQTEAREPQPQS